MTMESDARLSPRMVLHVMLLPVGVFVWWFSASQKVPTAVAEAAPPATRFLPLPLPQAVVYERRFILTINPPAEGDMPT